MENSLEIFQKRVPHRSMSDWHLGLSKLKDAARHKRYDAFDLRNLSTQLRNETSITTKWDTHKNNDKLRDRIFDVDLWRNELISTLERVEGEIFVLKQEKISTEKCMDALHIPLSVISECLSNRDSRRVTETTQDYLFVELRKELLIAENNQKHLADVCCDAWEMLTKLDGIKRRLQTEISNKYETLRIDECQMNMDKYCASISYKTDPFKIQDNSITESGWLELTKDTIKIANGLMVESKRIREILFKAREQANNELNAQRNILDHSLRKRIFETQRSRNELQWQRMKMKESLEKTAREIASLQDALIAKINVEKLVETRAENRTYRPHLELVRDKVMEGLEDEYKNIKNTVTLLKNKLDYMIATYNSMEKLLSDLEKDLEDKEDTLEIDSRCLEIRAPLANCIQTQTMRNITLSKLSNEIVQV